MNSTCKRKKKYSCSCHSAEGYAPFQSMVVRESFLTVSDSLAVAPGPGHYSPVPGQKLGSDRGRGTLHNKVISQS